MYNAALQERRDAWAKQGVRVSKYDQQFELKDVRIERPDLAEVPVLALRGVLNRLDKAYQAFFRRCRTGKKPGYPRFKSATRWDTLQFDQVTTKLIVAGDKRIAIPNLGKVRINLHRSLGGRPRAYSITLCGDGKWRVSIACDEVPTKPLPATGAEVGVDLGLTSFAATSDGEIFENPRPLREGRTALERAERRVSRRIKGSRRRRKAVALLRKRHARVANVRREHHIRVAKSLVARYDVIYVEALNIKGLARSRLAKSVNDAAWGGFGHWLGVKAEEAARLVIEVNPAGTSQECSGCGTIVPKELSVRIHRCPHCGLTIDRDVNAGINIKRFGSSLRRGTPVVVGSQRPEKRVLYAT